MTPINHKINISIQDFFITGKFDYLKPGQSKSWILDNFPAPDDFGGAKIFEKATIWRYGNIELHFIEERLHMIFSDYIDTLDGGNYIVLDKWILEKPEKLTLNHVIQTFNELKIDYSIHHKTTWKQVKLKVFSSGVELSFAANDNQLQNINDYLLFAFCLKDD